MQPSPDESPVWTEPLTICSYDVDFTRRTTCASLCRYFLEAAWKHAEALGVGFQRLADQGRFWVLARLLLEVRQWPLWGQRVTLSTWPRSATPLFALRDFELTNESGARLAAGSSSWLVLDAASKRPQRLGKLMPDLMKIGDRAALGRDPAKLEDGAEWEESLSVTARYTDVDVHRHVNSGRYIGWILDAYPFEFHRRRCVRVLEVNYLGETLEGESLRIRTRRLDAAACGHSLVKVNGEEVCRARLTWDDAPAGS